jgi:nucleotide-binding universal stress UspA family protein
MIPLDPILVPFDGSPHAQAAAGVARLVAARTGATTALFHAIPTTGDIGDRLEQAARADEMLTEEARRFSTPVQVQLLDGAPASTLAAETPRFGLVILGTRGRSVVSGLLLGSVARYLLHAVTRPVMAVHEAIPAITRVVVGVDASASAVATVTAARALADAVGASLTLVHVVDSDPAIAVDPQAIGVSEVAWAEAVAAHGEHIFRPLRPLARDADERVELGRPADVLRKVALAEGAQVIAVGRKGSSGRDVDAWTSVAFALAVRGPLATLVV